MNDANWHIFQTLSKFPDPATEVRSLSRNNVWVGVSLPAGHLMSETGGARALRAYLRHMKEDRRASALHEHRAALV